MDRRTNKQNRYYFGVMLPRIAVELFHKTDEIFTKDELHQLFKHLYGVGTTRELSPEKFSEYIESVIDKCINTFKVSPLVFNEDLDTWQYEKRKQAHLLSVGLKKAGKKKKHMDPLKIKVLKSADLQNEYLRRHLEPGEYV